VDARVERVSHFSCVAEQQGVLSAFNVGPVCGQSVARHGDLIASVEAVMGAVPVDRAANWCWAAVA
jgi:hypothetical protein